MIWGGGNPLSGAPAQAWGITGGYSDGTFRPDGTCTRAQMVTFLYRFWTTENAVGWKYEK